jgi:hypothetical protein
MDTVNETPPGQAATRKAIGCDRNQSHSQAPSNSKDWEERRNSSACFKNKDKREPWQNDYVGVVVIEGLPDGAKAWVKVKQRTTRNGETYLTVTLKPFRGR